MRFKLFDTTEGAKTPESLKKPCPRCKAPVGYFCATPKGRQCPPHTERTGGFKHK